MFQDLAWQIDRAIGKLQVLDGEQSIVAVIAVRRVGVGDSVAVAGALGDGVASLVAEVVRGVESGAAL